MSNDCLQRVVYIAKLSYTPQYRIEGFKGEPLGPWRRTIIFRGLRGALNCTSIMPRGASGCKIFHSNCWSNKRMHAKKSIYESCSIKHCLDYNYSISIDLTSNGILFVAKSIRTHYSWLINYVFILSYVISLFRLVWPRTVFSLMLNQSENYIDNSNCDQFNQIQKYLYLCKRVQRAYVQQLKKNIYIYIRLYFTFLQHYTFSWSIKITDNLIQSMQYYIVVWLLFFIMLRRIMISLSFWSLYIFLISLASVKSIQSVKISNTFSTKRLLWGIYLHNYQS